MCVLLALSLLLVCGCGSVEQSDQSAQPLRLFSRGGDDSGASDSGSSGTASGSFTAPPFAASDFHEDLAEGSGGVRIDLSAAADGYVAVSAESDRRLKFQVVKEDEVYNYDLASDGTPSIFPLQCGDGEYRFRVMENVTDNKYAEMFSTTRAVTLRDEFQPFLRPSAYINYRPDSNCVKKAGELASGADDPLGVVGAVYTYVCSSVVYDSYKAETVRSGYLPDPDETMETGKGICFDYAALAASMLRSQGIPTKMVFGYVSPDGLYHAWNMFYTEETGWVAVRFEVEEDSWVRLDLTFSAGGADSKFIGDGSNYSDVYYY